MITRLRTALPDGRVLSYLDLRDPAGISPLTSLSSMWA